MSDDVTTPEGFTRRIEPLAEELVGFVRRLADRGDDVEDVLQSALASAWRHRAHFVAGTNFRAWIYRFAVHEAANANRRRARERTRLRPLDGEGADPGFWERLDADLAYAELLGDPGALLERLDAELARALAVMNLDERAVLLLRSIAGMTCAEIATVLEVPRGTVLAWLFRARAKVRQRLGAPAVERGRAGRSGRPGDPERRSGR